MNNLLQYLFEVALGSSMLFLGFIVLKHALSLKFRRFYLLGCLLIPLVLPLTRIDSSQPEIVAIPQKIDEVFVAKEVSVDQAPSVTNNQKKVASKVDDTSQTKTSLIWSWSRVLVSFYVLVSFLLLGRFIASLWTVLKLKRSAVLRSGNPPFYTLNKKDFTAGSFFGWIFIHEKYVNHPSFEILHAHEHAHVQLWHSIDVLFAEVYCILFWMNPIAWFVKKEVKINAEFEADRYVHPQFGASNYSNTLINLSVGTQPVGPMVSFSARNIKTRIIQVVSDQKHRWQNALGLIPFLFFACWMISCEPEMMDFSSMDPQAAMKNVKTVTTRYISHQRDTQQKDGNIIAVAYYLPDGTVDRVEQHMTYPYDFKNSFKREFITSPDPVGVQYILDGLDLGIAENNLLYGNDWPKYFTEQWRKKNASDRFFSKRQSIQRNDQGLPTKLINEIEVSKSDTPYFFYVLEKENQILTSDVTNRMITEYSYTENRLEHILEKIEAPEKILLLGNRHGHHVEDGELIKKAVGFIYENDKLLEVTGTAKNFKFSYNHDVLVKSEYHLHGKTYHSRDYYYNSDGLKTRTEIFNVYGEPEYTIIYDYEYY